MCATAATEVPADTFSNGNDNNAPRRLLFHHKILGYRAIPRSSAGLPIGRRPCRTHLLDGPLGLKPLEDPLDRAAAEEITTPEVLG